MGIAGLSTYSQREYKIRPSLPTDGVKYFGVCRCLPGVKDGTWEYLATVEVPAGTRAPEGLKEVDIPRGEYLVGDVASLKEIGAAWQTVPKAAAELKGYGTYCGPSGCECAQHPPLSCMRATSRRPEGSRSTFL